MSQQFTWSQITPNNGSNGRYWIVIHGKVHDITSFLEQHPGGEEILMSLAGKDGTECFDDIGHSHEAKKLCEQFVIGELVEHPGGEEVLLEQAGGDASEAFEDVGHSSDAREMMAKYKIGELVESERKPVQTKKSPSWSSGDVDTGNGASWKSWLVPVVFGLLATIIYRYFLGKP